MQRCVQGDSITCVHFMWIFWVCRLCRQHKLYNKELYADFIAAQIKTLSFLAYIIRIYQVCPFVVRNTFAFMDIHRRKPHKRFKLLFAQGKLDWFILCACVSTISGAGRKVFPADGEGHAPAAHQLPLGDGSPPQGAAHRRQAHSHHRATQPYVLLRCENHTKLALAFIHILEKANGDRFVFAEFIPCMDKLFDESILIGSGYTARETLR